MVARLLFCGIALASVAAASPFSRAIFYDGPADEHAAREARRYILLTTGGWAQLVDSSSSSSTPRGWLAGADAAAEQREAVVIAAPGSALLADLSRQGAGGAATAAAAGAATAAAAGALAAAPVSAHAVSRAGAAVLLLGTGAVDRLYAVYTLAERLGARFDLHADVLPDPTAPGGLPLAHCSAAPLPIEEEEEAAAAAAAVAVPTFEYRGLQPFHDFVEGPDWWDGDAYKHVIGQIAKMKMNFIGLHTYPYAPNTPTATGKNEPTVWVGLASELEGDGTIAVGGGGAYPTSYANTLRGEWAEAALPTSNYSFGTAELFESDCWAPPPQSTAADACPYPTTAAAQVALFEAAADMLQAAFAHGKKVGIQSCVGTETALSKPAPPPPPAFNGSCAPVRALGCFQDAPARLFNHTVTIKDERVSQEWCAAQCAAASLPFAGVEFSVACFCSPALPPAAAKIDDAKCGMKCAANQSETCGGGYTLQAYTFACDAPTPAPAPPPPPPSTQDYYEGIFTRLSKRIPALDWYWAWTPEAWEWGHMTREEPAFTAAVADLAAAMAAKEALGYDVKMATNGWVVGPLPDRTIFDQVLPTSWDAITSIDLNTGHTPVDPAYANVTRHAKWVIPWMEDDPTLTQPQLWVNRTLAHMEDAAAYGCSGLLGIHWRTRAAAPQISAMAQKSWDPALTSQAFWADWCAAQFGTAGAANARLAAVFEGVDSTRMPITTVWANGPGQVERACAPAGTFAFVDELLAAGAAVAGAANGARFDYWASTFRYQRAMAGFGCAWKASDAAMARVRAASGAAAQKALAQSVGLPARVALVANATAMMAQLQRTLSTPGELGTYVNIESHSLLGALATDLPLFLGAALPPSAVPPHTFGGDAPRLIVPTARTSADTGDATTSFRALLLGAAQFACTGATLHHRPLGSGGDAWTAAPMANVGRSVFTLALANAQLGPVDYEYYISATGGPACAAAVFPAGAPAVAQSVVWM